MTSRTKKQISDLNVQSQKALSDKANQIEEISKNLTQSQKDANDKQNK